MISKDKQEHTATQVATGKQKWHAHPAILFSVVAADFIEGECPGTCDMGPSLEAKNTTKFRCTPQKFKSPNGKR